MPTTFSCPPYACPIAGFMSADHARIDGLLAAAEASDGSIDPDTYAKFRHDLLRHIGMEEKVLFPYLRARRGGTLPASVASLHADHGEIAKLLVRSPNGTVVTMLREILERHNALEEGPTGLYSSCDELAGDETSALLSRLRDQPTVPLAKYYDGPLNRRR